MIESDNRGQGAESLLHSVDILILLLRIEACDWRASF